MQSDPGAGVPHTGGNDDEVWRDLVARLEEPDDAFMDGPHALPGAATSAGTNTSEPTSAELNSAESKSGDPATSDPSDPKGVIDFDPLGVWQQLSEPAPREPAAPGQQGPPAFGPRDYAAQDEGEGEFVPEELPSLGESDPAIMASWIGAAGGPLFLVFSAIFWRHAPWLLVMAVIVAFIAGTGYLLYRLPNHRDHDGDDGAVV